MLHCPGTKNRPPRERCPRAARQGAKGEGRGRATESWRRRRTVWPSRKTRSTRSVRGEGGGGGVRGSAPGVAFAGIAPRHQDTKSAAHGPGKGFRAETAEERRGAEKGNLPSPSGRRRGRGRSHSGRGRARSHQGRASHPLPPSQAPTPASNPARPVAGRSPLGLPSIAWNSGQSRTRRSSAGPQKVTRGRGQRRVDQGVRG